MSAHPETVDRARAERGLRWANKARGERLERGVQDAAAVARQAFSWWTRELATLLPARVRERLAASDRRLIVLVEAGDALLVLENGTHEPLGRVALDRNDPSATLRALARRHGLAPALDDGGLAISLRLPAEKALRTTIALPLAAETNLDEVLSYELDRHTPFSAEQAYLSARVVRRDVAAQRLQAELTVVPRPVVDEALGIAQRLALQIDRVDVSGGPNGGPVSGNVLPRARAVAGRRKANRTTYALVVAAAVLAAVAIYLPLARLQHEAAVTEQKFAAIRSAAALQRQVEQALKQRLFIVDRKRATVPVSTLLLELTRLLPDDTSLTTLQVQAGEVQLGGTARSAAALIGLLEQSHKFSSTTFRTPVTQDPVTSRETFYIVTRIVTEQTP
jgi:general secretion pathway protein L